MIHPNVGAGFSRPIIINNKRGEKPRPYNIFYPRLFKKSSTLLIHSLVLS
jgi:hypothetical protein